MSGEPYTSIQRQIYMFCVVFGAEVQVHDVAAVQRLPGLPRTAADEVPLQICAPPTPEENDGR